MKKHLCPNSIQLRIPLLVAAVVLPLMALLLVCNLYSARLLQKQAADLGRNTISLFSSQVTTTLSLLEKGLLGMDLDQDAFASAPYSPEDRRTLARMKARQSLNDLLSTYSFLDGVFLYYPEEDRVAASTVDYFDLGKKQALLDQALSFSRQFEEGGLSAWAGMEAGGSYYLLRILRQGSLDIGMWLDISDFFLYAGSAETQRLDHIGLVSSGGQPLFDGFPGFQQQFDMEKSLSSFGAYRDGAETYNTIAVPIGKGSLSVVGLQRSAHILQGMDVMQNIIAAVTVLLFLLAPLLFLQIDRRVVRPARQIAGAMQGLGKGDLSIRFQGKKVYDEFQLIGTTFNEMASEISRLKIEAYEKQLAEQRTELQFLQLQLTPHFYINSLNVIYSLAQVSDFDAIRQMVLALTEYFRYSLKAHTHLSSLKDELRHVENYVAIQKLRYSNRLQVAFQVEEGVEDAQVPLFLLQTFVENSMKYAFTGEGSIQVRIQAGREGSRLWVDIQDNGPGYPPQVLDGSLFSQPGNPHIGIENVKGRLALLYRDGAALSLSNLPEGGAHTAITIPYQKGEAHVSPSFS